MLNFLKSFVPAPPAATAEVLSSSALGWRPFPVCHCHHRLPCQTSAVPSLWHRCWAARAARANIFPVVFLAKRDFTFSSPVVLAHALHQRSSSSSSFADMAPDPCSNICYGNLRQLSREPCFCSSHCCPKLQIWRGLPPLCVLAFSETTGPHIS